MEGKYILGSVGAACLAAYGITCAVMGIDGTVPAVVIGGIVAVVAGVAGFEYGKKK